MDVRVLVAIELGNPVNHGLRLLRGGRIVEPNELLAPHSLLQNRKVPANRLDVKRRMAELEPLELRLEFADFQRRGSGRAAI